MSEHGCTEESAPTWALEMIQKLAVEKHAALAEVARLTAELACTKSWTQVIDGVAHDQGALAGWMARAETAEVRLIAARATSCEQKEKLNDARRQLRASRLLAVTRTETAEAALRELIDAYDAWDAWNDSDTYLGDERGDEINARCDRAEADARVVLARLDRAVGGEARDEG